MAPFALTPRPSLGQHEMQRILRFNVFGTLVGIERSGPHWKAYYLGTEGKRRPADFVIPEFVVEAELAQYLADLFHESARPGHSEVRAL